MIPFTLTQLSYVVAVDRHAHFGKAAAACHVTQPTLSMQVQKLERTLGAALFDRSKAPVVPTDLGRLIVEQARAVLRAAEQLAELRDASRGAVVGELRLGVIPTLAPYLVPRFVQQLGEKHPRLQLVVRELVTDDILGDLRHDEIDAGLIATAPVIPGLLRRHLFDEPFVGYVSAGHRLASHAALHSGDLALDDLWLLTEGHCLREQTLHLCHQRARAAPRGASGEEAHREGGGLRVRFESGNLETLKRLVARGRGMTLLPLLATLDPDTEVHHQLLRPFAPPVPVRHVSLVRRRGTLKQHLVDALVAELLASLPAELQPRRAPAAAAGTPSRK